MRAAQYPKPDAQIEAHWLGCMEADSCPRCPEQSGADPQWLPKTHLRRNNRAPKQLSIEDRHRRGPIPITSFPGAKLLWPPNPRTDRQLAAAGVLLWTDRFVPSPPLKVPQRPDSQPMPASQSITLAAPKHQENSLAGGSGPCQHHVPIDSKTEAFLLV
jgi:hypothetical protein